jgi:hypothetical protein
MERVAIRTVWLGLVLFFGLAGLAFVQAGPRCVAIDGCSSGVGGAANKHMPEVGISPEADTLTKSDRLPVD